MDNEAYMVILFVSHENEPFTLLEIRQILICQNQKLQIPIFMVYKASEAQLTKIKYNSYVMEICLEIPWRSYQFRFVLFRFVFRHLRYSTLWAKL